MENDVDLARPVIFLTAKAQAADYRRFIELGIRGVIAKPFDPLTLGKQVREKRAIDSPDHALIPCAMGSIPSAMG